MGNEGLKIVIGADISEVTSELKVASSNVAQFGDTAAKAFDEVAASASALDRVSVAIDNMVSEALGGGQQVEQAFEEPLKSISQLESEIESLNSELSHATDFESLKRLNDQINKTKTQLNNLKVIGFQSTLDKINPSATNAAKGIDKVSKAADGGGAALLGINRVLQDLPFGFVSIQNNLTELPNAFKSLSNAAKESGQSITKVFLSSLLGAGGIGTGISLITSALTFASVGFGAWTRGFTSSSEAAKKASGSLSEYEKLVQGVTQEVGQSASRITTLVSALQSTSLNTAQRKKALDELKQQNQEFFGSLKEEKGVIEGLQAAYDGYLERIKAIATAKALESQLTKLFDKKLQLELSLDPKFKAATSGDVQKQIGDLQKQLNKLGGPLSSKEQTLEIQTGNEALKKRSDLMFRIAKLKTANVFDLAGTNDEIADIDRQIAGLVELQKSIGNFSVTGSTEKQKKDQDGLEKQLSLLEKIRDAAKEFQGKLFDLKDIESATDKLAALEQQVGDLKLKIALRDAKKAKLPASEIEKLTDAIKQDTQKRLNEAFEKEALLLEFNPKLKPSHVPRLDVSDLAAHSFTTKEQLKVVLDGENLKFEVKDIPVDVTDLQGRIAKATGLDKKIPAITLHEARILINGKKITAQIEGKEHIIDELNKQVAGIFEGGLNDALSGIGEAFGEALASSDFGSGLKKAAENILGVVGNVMQQLGKAVIAAAIKIKLLKETLEKWAIANPGLAIIAGIGLIAAGAALKNLKFDGPKFADGGIATGPVIGQVGERFRPEVILPLDRLPQLFKQIGGDVGGGMQLIPIINNEGLYLAMKRGERSAGRKF
jgi:cell division septum initiation protein DivIVA